LLRRCPRFFARACDPDARELGQLGEELATCALLRAGFVIEGRRVRTPHAEIDILARDDRSRTLVVVEVKTARFEPIPAPRGTSVDLARGRYRDAGRLGRAQALRLQRAADWIGHRRRMRTRVDLVEVWLRRRPRSVQVQHRRIDAGKSFRAAGR
jgi:Holliday junction resolvase-like predicted endonuclease